MSRILVMGTGGVGGAFGAMAAAGGHDVVFVARGSSLAALRSSGLRVTGTRTVTLDRVEATDDPSAVGRVDLVLLAVKSYDVLQAARLVEPCGGLVLTLQNGIDAPAVATSVLGDRVLAGSTNIVSDLVSPGHVEVVSSYTRIRFGEPGGGGVSGRVFIVASWLDPAGIEMVAEPDVRFALWDKMAHMCAMAGLTTLYRSPIGPILAGAEGRATYERVVTEAANAARASGVPLADDFVQGRMAWAAQVPPDATSSMLRDLLRGKRLELDALNGTIVRLGHEHGVGVPLNEAIVAGVRLA